MESAASQNGTTDGNENDQMESGWRIAMRVHI